jgi:hypothetical protein
MDIVAALHERIEQLETENQAMREILSRIAQGRMARDQETMIESCLYCTLKRGGEYGYAGKHGDECVVTLARQLGL